MVSRIYDFDIITTDTHLEALVLECELIKKLKPIYNRQFKNHGSYVYLRIRNNSRLSARRFAESLRKKLIKKS
jgi:excinuclease ABC subunit C